MDAIITVDEQQRIVLFNHAAEEIFGWTRQEMLGQPLEKLIPAQFHPTHAQQVEQYGNSGISSRRMGLRRVVYGLRANGEQFPLDASISMLNTPSGKLFTAIVRDITEINRLQEEENSNNAQLRESQRRLLVAQRLARISYWQLDLTTQLVWWCDEACNVLGVDRAFLNGSHDELVQLIHPGDREAFKAEREVAVQAGLPLETEFRIITASHEVRWIRLLGRVELDSQGMPTNRRTGMVQEITEHKRVEGVMARSAELLKRTGALAKVGGWEVIMDTRTPYCTEEIYRIHELDPSIGFVLEEATNFYAPEAQSVIRAAIKAAVEHGSPWDLELPFITAKGERIWVRTQGRATLQGDKVVRLFGVLQDITEIKTTEAALRLSNEELEAFSYSVSHDLRSPLNTINGFSHLLTKNLAGGASEKVRHYLSRIQCASEQMGQLIEDLLSLAQVTRAVLQSRPVDLSAMARTILEEWQERDPERQVTAHIESGLQALGDERLLRVMMENLLGNSWKFTSQKALAEISVGQKFDTAQLPVFFVGDNGAGFDMAYADKLFNPFQRLHAGFQFPGTGIGLAIVSRVIGRHVGRIWAESAPDCGASFFFTLPGGTLNELPASQGAAPQPPWKL